MCHVSCDGRRGKRDVVGLVGLSVCEREVMGEDWYKTVTGKGNERYTYLFSNI